MRPWALPTPHPTRSQDSRVFSSETPGNEAVLILQPLVLARDLHHAVLSLDCQLLGQESV